MRRILVVVIFATVFVGGAWFVFRGGGLANFDIGTIQPRLVGAAAAVESDYVVPELADNYRNSEYKFSLTMPEGFRSSELPADEGGGKAIIFQDDAGNGIQIYVTPFSGTQKILTADDIRRDIPDMQVENVQDVEVGSDYRGVAFMSDNDAYGGSSREVWFIFCGSQRAQSSCNLYQISTYARLDNLLQAMFGTWKFF